MALRHWEDDIGEHGKDWSLVVRGWEDLRLRIAGLGCRINARGIRLFGKLH